MTTSPAAGKILALAAAPAFAIMALIAANSTPHLALCAPSSPFLPFDGMTTMYLLMSLFHLSPWLKLPAGRAAHPLPEGD